MAGGESVSLVQATPADAELIFSYMRQLRVEGAMAKHSCADEAAMMRAAENLMGDRSLGRIWLIRSAQQPVGYAVLSFFHSLEFAGRCGLLDEFFIDGPYRGRGIGKSALKWICTVAVPDLEIRAVLLEVSANNDAAAGLYRSAGFQRRPYQLLFHEPQI